MRVLELFCGTKSFSKEAEKRGHKVITVDINPKFNPDINMDVLELPESCLIEFFKGDFDVIWASPPCEQYSHAKRRGKRNIEYANMLVLKTLRIINALKPKYWIIENPQTGLLKSQDFMNHLPYTDVSYCKYGEHYRKQTRLWNNFGLVLKTCNKNCRFMNGKKHIGSAGNGRKEYTDKNYKREEKYRIPRRLCIDILNQIEELNHK